MKNLFLATVAFAALSTAAQAADNTVLNTSFGAMAAPGTTTTTANGTTSTNAGTTNKGAATFVSNTWQQQNVRSNGVVGITKDYSRSGNGSLFLSTSGESNSKADLEYYLSTPISLGSLTGMSYDWYRASSSVNDPIQVPSLRLVVYQGAAYAGYLVYEPYYTDGGTRPTDQWVTSTISQTSGNFWTTSALNGPTFAADGGVKTLAAWLGANPSLSVVGFSTGVGSGWGAFTGAVDNISFTTTSGTQSFNFEVTPNVDAVPEPATWGMMVLGFGLAGAAVRRRRATAIVA